MCYQKHRQSDSHEQTVDAQQQCAITLKMLKENSYQTRILDLAKFIQLWIRERKQIPKKQR